MSWKRHFLEAATLVVAACLCAVVANAIASSERKLALIGSYPDALKVPAPAPPAVAPVPEPTFAPEQTPATPASVLPAPPVAPAATPLPGKKTTAAVPAAAATSPAAAVRLTDRFPPHPDKPFAEIAGADVAYLRDRGALVLDARRTSAYQEGHVAGARSVSVWEAEADRQVEAIVNEGRDTKQPVVIYCSGGDCEDSHMLAQKLFGAGFENLLVYRDGWPDWVKRGGAARTGAQP